MRPCAGRISSAFAESLGVKDSRGARTHVFCFRVFPSRDEQFFTKVFRGSPQYGGQTCHAPVETSSFPSCRQPPAGGDARAPGSLPRACYFLCVLCAFAFKNPVNPVRILSSCQKSSPRPLRLKIRARRARLRRCSHAALCQHALVELPPYEATLELSTACEVVYLIYESEVRCDFTGGDVWE